MSDRAQRLFAELLAELGFQGDPEMAATPERFTGLLRDFLPREPAPALSTFAHQADGPIVLRGLPFHSLCAHHLLPFFGTAAVAYVPNGRVAGLGGVARVLAWHAQRPQLQERLAEQVAATLSEQLAPRALIVRLRSRQLCMEMRGARSPGEVDAYATRGDVEGLLPLL